MNTSPFFLGLAVILLGLGAAVVFGPSLLRDKRGEQILAQGVTAEARVTDLQGTGFRGKYEPEIAVQLEVMPKDRAPYAVVVKLVLTEANGSSLAPGNLVIVRYLPSNPDAVVIVGPAP